MPSASLRQADGAILEHVAATLRATDRLDEALGAIDAALKATVGYRLFTALTVTPDRAEVERIYSTDPSAYPLNGRKHMGSTPWGDHVIRGRRAYVGRNDDDIRWAFPDHALIRSLGLASVLNVPIVDRGKCLGTLNLLHEADWYKASDVQRVEPFAALLIPIFVGLAV